MRPVLQGQWQGPYEVVKCVGSNTVEVADILNLQRNRTMSLFQLRKLTDVTPRARDELYRIASKVRSMCIVDKIVAHRPQRGSFQRMQFKVRWMGYGEESDTWEPYSSLKNVIALHDYSAAHPGLKIPVPVD